MVRYESKGQCLQFSQETTEASKSFCTMSAIIITIIIIIIIIIMIIIIIKTHRTIGKYCSIASIWVLVLKSSIGGQKTISSHRKKFR